MVISGSRTERESEKLMDTGLERSKPLHNFSLPCLKWGSRRFLRCMKVNSNGEVSAVGHRSSAAETENAVIERRRESELGKRRSVNRTDSLKLSPSSAAGFRESSKKSRVESDRDTGIEAIRAKLMFDFQTAVDQMKVPEDLWEEPAAAAPARTEAQTEADATRPWNLRTRRAACKAPSGIGQGGHGCGNGTGGKSLKVHESKRNFSPLRTESKPRLRGVATAEKTVPTDERKKRTKVTKLEVSLTVPLSRQKIEDDFKAMVGRRPPRRPKKRPKVVRKDLEFIFPGLWLTDITVDSYKVEEEEEEEEETQKR